MNKYQAKNLLPIIEAFAHGKQIQTIAQVTSDGKCMWVDTNEPHFETASRFRVKPERVYRPFQNGQSTSPSNSLYKSNTDIRMGQMASLLFLSLT